MNTTRTKHKTVAHEIQEKCKSEEHQGALFFEDLTGSGDSGRCLCPPADIS